MALEGVGFLPGPLDRLLCGSMDRGFLNRSNLRNPYCRAGFTFENRTEMGGSHYGSSQTQSKRPLESFLPPGQSRFQLLIPNLARAFWGTSRPFVGCANGLQLGVSLVH